MVQDAVVDSNDLVDAAVPKRYDSFKSPQESHNRRRPFSPLSSLVAKSARDDDDIKDHNEHDEERPSSAIQARLNSNYASSTHRIVLLED